MLNENLNKIYEISPLTMAVLPVSDDETGAMNTVIIEQTGSYRVPSPPTKLIDSACRFFGSSLQGRVEGTREISRFTHKAPIVIDPSTGMFFFPTMSPRNRNCAWINHSYVENVQAINQKQTKVVFSNNEYVIVDISYGSMVNQLQRTAQFRFSLENRMKQIHSEMKKKLPQQIKQP
ncbi:MAG TPA: competence protein ComK [Pseudogracilibacillus sp.]|nr:competence protein ComK [Pseudogracilibacillus sp.]